MSPIPSVILFIFLWVIFQTAEAQQPPHQTVSTAGNSYTNGALQLDFTLGQLLIASHSNANLIVTQGFHQPFAAGEEALSLSPSNVQILAYPNPTQDLITLSSSDDGKRAYKIFNLNGQAMLSGTFQKLKVIDLTHLAKGAYQLLVTNDQEQLVQAFKIQLK